jgi:predicted DNA-binding transcriptional regulator AlpA
MVSKDAPTARQLEEVRELKEIDTEDGTAQYIGKPAKTLSQWRWRGEGPPYVKCGNSVRYRRIDVDAWLARNTVHPRSAGS